MMKHFLALFLSLFLLCAAPAALAGDWGLEGELLDLIAGSGLWDDYVCMHPQTGNIAALKGQYHNVLIMEENGELKTFTKALYQPGGSYDGYLALAANDRWFNMTYHENLWFMFEKRGDHHFLVEAVVYDLYVALSPDESYYTFTSTTGESAVLNRGIWLEHFNIELFPQTLDEVRHLNRMLATLDGASYCLGTTDVLFENCDHLGKATVVTAPYIEDAWRAANGRATVSFKGDVWMLRAWRNQYGGEYYCIRYDVSTRTQRIGFIRRSHVDGVGADPWPETVLLNTRVITTRPTYLTDDPDVSQYPQFRFPKGAILTCMGTYDDNYAYVSTVDNLGRIVWGFVPLRDLEMRVIHAKEYEPEVMQALEGVWWFKSGDTRIADLVTLRADGTYEGFLFTAQGEPSCTGKWYVTRHDPISRMYRDEPVYEITFLDETGAAIVDGLTFDADENANEFTMTGQQESCLYFRMNGK